MRASKKIKGRPCPDDHTFIQYSARARLVPSREICMTGLKNRGRLTNAQSASNFIGQILLEIVFKVHYDIAEIADECVMYI